MNLVATLFISRDFEEEVHFGEEVHCEMHVFERFVNEIFFLGAYSTPSHFYEQEEI